MSSFTRYFFVCFGFLILFNTPWFPPEAEGSGRRAAFELRKFGSSLLDNVGGTVRRFSATARAVPRRQMAVVRGSMREAPRAFGTPVSGGTQSRQLATVPGGVATTAGGVVRRETHLGYYLGKQLGEWPALRSSIDRFSRTVADAAPMASTSLSQGLVTGNAKMVAAHQRLTVEAAEALSKMDPQDVERVRAILAGVESLDGAMFKKWDNTVPVEWSIYQNALECLLIACQVSRQVSGDLKHEALNRVSKYLAKTVDDGMALHRSSGGKQGISNSGLYVDQWNRGLHSLGDRITLRSELNRNRLSNWQ